MAKTQPASQMSYEEMKAAIERGETLIHEGRMIRNVKDLPSPSAAATTAEEKAEVLRGLVSRREALDKQIEDAHRDHQETIAREEEAKAREEEVRTRPPAPRQPAKK